MQGLILKCIVCKQEEKTRKFWARKSLKFGLWSRDNMKEKMSVKVSGK